MSKKLLFLKVCSFKRSTKIPNLIGIFFFKSIFHKMRRTLSFLKFNLKKFNLKVKKIPISIAMLSDFGWCFIAHVYVQFFFFGSVIVIFPVFFFCLTTASWMSSIFVSFSFHVISESIRTFLKLFKILL